MRSVLVLYELPAVILIDKVIKSSSESTIQARFFAYNNDGQGHIQRTENGLHIARPHAHLHTFSFSTQLIRSASTHLPLPTDIAKKYPFGEIATVHPAKEVFLISALFPVRSSESDPDVLITEQKANSYEVLLEGQPLVLIEDVGKLPEFIVT